MVKLIDLTGQRFGKLTVIERAQNNGKKTMWNCLCDCGQVVSVAGSNLVCGHTRSCGCLWMATVPKNNRVVNFRHGDSHTKLHKAWANMRYRCNNPKCKCYSNYGGRGIKVCEEWNTYENFRDWALNNGFSDGATIDRINNNGNYEPSNCRWVGYKEQINNRRVNHVLTHNGETHTISEWSEITGLKWTTINERLKRGWTIEKTLTKAP